MDDIDVSEMRVRHLQASLTTFQKVLDFAKQRFLPGYCISTPIKIEKDIMNKEDDLLIDTPPLQNNDDVDVLALIPSNTQHTGTNNKSLGHNTNNIIDDLNAEQNIVTLNNNDKNNIKKNVKGQKRSNESTSKGSLSNKRSKNDVVSERTRVQLTSDDVSPPNPIISDNVQQQNPDILSPPNPSECSINQLKSDSKEGNNHVIPTDVSITASSTNPTSTLLNRAEYREQLANKIINLRDKLPSDKKFDVNDALRLTLKEVMDLEIKRHPDNAYIESKLFKNNLISNIMQNKDDSKYVSCNPMQMIVHELYLLDRSYQKQKLHKENNKKIVSERQRIQVINDATTLKRLEGIKGNTTSEIDHEIVTKTVKKMDKIVNQPENEIFLKISMKQNEMKKVSKIQEDYRERRKQLVTREKELDVIKHNESTGGDVKVKVSDLCLLLLYILILTI